VVSYVGEPFEYDVFVSYAHAKTETGTPLIRNWSKHVAGRLRDLLASGLNLTAAESTVKVFLDEREIVSGDPLEGLKGWPQASQHILAWSRKGLLRSGYRRSWLHKERR
jgi:hypothetical protein